MKTRARFVKDGHGYTFEIIDATGRIVRQSWVAGPKSDAIAAADHERMLLNAESNGDGQ